jgi:TonB family protein
MKLSALFIYFKFLVFTVLYLISFDSQCQNNQGMIEVSKPDSIKKDVMAFCQEMPRFPGCEDIADLMERSVCAHRKMMTYINENLKYPLAAKNDLIEGKVIVRFIVTTEGKVENAEILHDIGSGCGNEVLRVIQTMNAIPQKWIPGKHFGKTVNVYVKVPIEFRLTDRWKEKVKSRTPEDLDLTKETVVDKADEMPQFPGCNKVTDEIEKQNCATAKFIYFINANLKYPEGSLNKDIDGKVLARFVVRKDGYVSNIEILEDLEGGFGDEVKKVISNMNRKELRWSPGKINGEPVHVFISLPVNFKRKAQESGQTEQKK